MNLHALASIMTPFIFRPPELTSDDIFDKVQLIEMFKIIIQDYEEILYSKQKWEKSELENKARYIKLFLNRLVVN